MAIDIVDFPINSMVMFHSYVKLPEGKCSSEKNEKISIFNGKISIFNGKITMFNGKITMFHGKIHYNYGKIHHAIFMGKSNINDNCP